MTLKPTERVAVDRAKDPAKLPLNPEEFFVLSRIDGQPTINEIVALCGLDAPMTQKILARLLELGAVQIVGGAGAERTRSRKRDQAAARRGKPEKDQPPAGRRDRARVKEPEPKRNAPSDAKPPAEDPAPADAAPVVAPVPEDDARIEPSCDLPVDDQRQLLALQDRLETLTHFEILNIQPTADRRAIRVAFRHVSRRFHPDAHYGKDVGRYADLLAELFVRAKQAHRILADDDTRVVYVEKLLEPERKRQRATEEAEALARAYAAEQERREVEKEAARRAREDKERLMARRKRDDARARKQRKAFAGHMPAGAVEARRDKAREHCEEGKRLMKAGSLGAAANLFRLAKELAPNEAEYHELWQQCFLDARRDRSERAFARAQRATKDGEHADAAQLYVEAAEANPTALYLSFAADAIRDTDPSKARDMALRCLDTVNASAAMGGLPGGAEAGGIHVRLGRVFLAAGQKHSAEHHAGIARKHLPDDPEVLALLDSIKVT